MFIPLLEYMENQSKTSSAEISKKVWQIPVIELISQDSIQSGTSSGPEGLVNFAIHFGS
jgi:hypothetical protein